LVETMPNSDLVGPASEAGTQAVVFLEALQRSYGLGADRHSIGSNGKGMAGGETGFGTNREASRTRDLYT